MEKIELEGIKLIGITTRTTNENGQAASDIPQLWSKFMSEGIVQQIPQKTEDAIYCVYCEYEKDYTKPYTVFLGCKVDSLNSVPEGLTGKSFPGGTYQPFKAKGNLNEGAVYNEWVKIWSTSLNRTYTADFEIYGQKAQDFANAEVDILIGIN